MGRARIAMEFIRKEQKRDLTFQKRKKGLLKKAHELSILCNVPVCIIIYPYKEGNSRQCVLPEVYTFKGGNAEISTEIDLSRAMDPKLARELIDRYLAFPRADERIKRSLNLSDMFEERKRKADQELSKLRHKNARVTISNFSVDQLIELLIHLDHKLEVVKEKIAVMRSNNGNHSVLPMMITSDNNNNHNSYLALQQPDPYNQLVPFEPNNNGTYVDHNNNNNNNIGGCNFGYNMNMMEPIYIDQGQDISGNYVVSSSHGVGACLPISVPFHQYFPMLSNFHLPKYY